MCAVHINCALPGTVDPAVDKTVSFYGTKKLTDMLPMDKCCNKVMIRDWQINMRWEVKGVGEQRKAWHMRNGEFSGRMQ